MSDENTLRHLYVNRAKLELASQAGPQAVEEAYRRFAAAPAGADLLEILQEQLDMHRQRPQLTRIDEQGERIEAEERLPSLTI
jgi:hypothetical protein